MPRTLSGEIQGRCGAVSITPRGEQPCHSASGAASSAPGLAIALACGCCPAVAAARLGRPPAPPATRLVYATGKIVPIPASIPHEAGDMVDSRILPDLRWIAERYPIYVTDGYSGPLPSGEHAGCDECHTKGSDHYNGLAVDLVPLGGGPNATPPGPRSPASPSGPSRSRRAGAALPLGRLRRRRRPRLRQPPPPLLEPRPGAQFALAEWVEVFPAGPERHGRPPARQELPGPEAPARPLRRHLACSAPAASAPAASATDRAARSACSPYSRHNPSSGEAPGS